jgi:hypothetical protein
MWIRNLIEPGSGVEKFGSGIDPGSATVVTGTVPEIWSSRE